ncbi:MAG: hypothetical protein ACI4QL_02185 [Candidatus Fimimonas sp.]
MDVLKKIQKLKRQTAETLNDAFELVRGLDDLAEIKKWCKWIRSKTKKTTYPTPHTPFLPARQRKTRTVC